MTEAEWQECTDPTPMLKYLQDKVSDRKLWLFACACCRHIWYLFHNERACHRPDASCRILPKRLLPFLLMRLFSCSLW